MNPSFPPSAVWIGSDHPFDLNEVYLCFRSPQAWQLEKVPAQAELLVTADSRYKLWINGKFVSRGPARSYPSAQSVDRLEVAKYLVAGQNTLAIQVYQPGYSHFSYVHRGMAGLLLHLVCDGETALVSDTHWRTRRDRSFKAEVPRVSIYGTGMEERDNRLVEADWMKPAYDDQAWANARLVAPVGGYPWTGMKLRALPMLVERKLPLAEPKFRDSNTQPEENDRHLAVRNGWYESWRTPRDPSLKGWHKIYMHFCHQGHWLFDLGRNYTCQGWAEVTGAKGREQLSITYIEKEPLVKKGERVPISFFDADAEKMLIISDPEDYCRVRMTDSFTLRKGKQTCESFALRGGRYVLFTLKGYQSAWVKVRFHVRVSEYPLTVTKPLTTDDPELNQIITLCEETMRACLQDGFVDCNWRESSQWLGDALPQALIMSSMCDDLRPLRQVIEMAAQGAYSDGVLPSILPGEVHAYAVVDYNFTWVELLKLDWDLTGDIDFLQGMWPTLQRLLDRFHQDLNADGLILSQPGRRLFLDWAPLSRNEPSAVYNLRYLQALQVAATLAACGGEAALDEGRVWAARATALQQAIRDAFWQDGRWYDDLERTTFSQLAAALAILTGSVEPSEQDGLVDAISARSLDLNDEPIPDAMVLASPFMHHYLFEALRQAGQEAVVIEIIRRRWGRWVEAGYPTTWENWTVDFPDGSQCHAFSAHPRYHLAAILNTE